MTEDSYKNAVFHLTHMVKRTIQHDSQWRFVPMMPLVKVRSSPLSSW